MAGLRAGYKASVRERLATMAALLAALRAQPADIASLQELRRHVHNLAGSGGTYGFTVLTAAAQAGELRLEALLAGGAPWREPHFAELGALLKQLDAALEARVEGRPHA